MISLPLSSYPIAPSTTFLWAVMDSILINTILNTSLFKKGSSFVWTFVGFPSVECLSEASFALEVWGPSPQSRRLFLSEPASFPLLLHLKPGRRFVSRGQGLPRRSDVCTPAATPFPGVHLVTTQLLCWLLNKEKGRCERKKKADYSFSFLWKFCLGILFLFRMFPQKPIPLSTLAREHFLSIFQNVYIPGSWLEVLPGSC